MKKYKLIKEYPGSPKLGTILKQWYKKENPDKILYGSEDKLSPALELNIVENNPEFWKEIVEKNYEIISWISNGKLECINDEKVYFDSKFDKIHSVKRLSDGEIFTVGDLVENDKFIGNIYNFRESNNGLKVYYNNWDYLKDISKVKKPLFTTEDGVDIFEGDKCWGVIDTYPWKVYQVNTKHDLDWIHKLTFSTKEAAEEYLLMNKPCLSINDVISISYNPVETKTSTVKKLIKLVKSKL